MGTAALSARSIRRALGLRLPWVAERAVGMPPLPLQSLIDNHSMATAPACTKRQVGTAFRS